MAGNVRILPITPGGYLSPFIDQQNMLPQKYVDFADGPGFGTAADQRSSRRTWRLVYDDTRTDGRRAAGHRHDGVSVAAKGGLSERQSAY